jgi:hypothetical protein
LAPEKYDLTTFLLYLYEGRPESKARLAIKKNKQNKNKNKKILM